MLLFSSRAAVRLGCAAGIVTLFVSLVLGQQQQYDAQQQPLQFAGNVTEATCHDACTSLLSTLTSQNVYYETIPSMFFNHTDYFSQVQAVVRPACLVLPTSAEDVSTAVTILRQHKCHFAIKSGGHAMFRGASNAPSGVTLDLRYLNQIELSEDKKTVSVGTGLRWRQVYDFVDPLNLTVVGGRELDVGVGGFLLGGGISWISRQYGWGCDNVRNYELVLANGSIINVNQKSNPDLYWALRGGGKNFGIVTRFDLETHPNANFWGGWSMYLLQDYEKELATIGLPRHLTMTISGLLEYIASFAVKFGCLLGYCVRLDTYVDILARLIVTAEHDAYAQAYGWLFLLPHANIFAVGSQMTHGAGLDAAPAFGDLYHLKSMYSSVGYKSSTQLAREIVEVQPIGMRVHFETASFKKINGGFLREILHIYMEEVELIRNVPSLHTASCPLQLITKDEIRHMKRNGGNALGLSESDAPLLLFSTAFGWKDTAQDATVYNTSGRIIQRMRERATELGHFHPYIYQNYAGREQDVFEGYGEKNRKRLRKIRDKVDPDHVFTRLVPGYFAL